MPFKDFNTVNWVATLYGVIAAIGGFIADYLQRVKAGQPFCFWLFFWELIVSVFVGLLLFSIAETLNQPPAFCAAVAAVGGNMGTRVFGLARALVSKRVKKELDK